ncbi:MAG: T9SS type A sorting domain-containing protein [Chlorobi bacterium]|nr:T9SS type A sorting domain-containing protein [Chlorobiota bacterium]
MKKSLLLIMAMAIGQFIFAQDCSDLFISEYVEGSGNNKAIEIYNPTLEAIDLGSYQLVRYSNGGFEPAAIGLAGTIGSHDTYVVVLDKRDPNGIGFEEPIDSALMMMADTFLCPVYDVNKMMYFNGNDAVTLELTTGVVVDIVARVGSPDPDNGWTDITDTTITWNNNGTPEEYTINNYIVGPLFWLSWTKDNTLIRKNTVKKGVLENPDVFKVAMEWDSLPKNTFENLGEHLCDCAESGIADNAVNINVTLFPNPVTGNELNIDSEEIMTSIEVINTIGQAFLREDLQSGTKTHSMSLKSYDSGVYFVKITFKDHKTLIKKIVIK